ncbi:hypothetical protein FB451DRAFT_1509772 [Mycena latifolia]|nr:hypothetical protein FB451DRAFT_1509772 [Mycena latifolia]
MRVCVFTEEDVLTCVILLPVLQTICAIHKPAGGLGFFRNPGHHDGYLNLLQGRRILRLAGSTTLQWYYVKTNLSGIYSFALVLHPSSKLEYFRANSFDPDWISGVETKLRVEYETYCERCRTQSPSTIVMYSACLRAALKLPRQTIHPSTYV